MSVGVHGSVEAERQLGRPDAGQHVAVKAVDRAVRLVCFALRRGWRARPGSGDPR